MKLWTADDPDYRVLLQEKLNNNIEDEDGVWDKYNILNLAMWEATEEVARKSHHSENLTAGSKSSLALTLYVMIIGGPERYDREGDNENKKCRW